MASKMTMRKRTITLMGFRSVGKTALCVRYTKGDFEECYDPTIVNTFQNIISVNNQNYNLYVIDTAGQDEYTIHNTFHSLSSHGYIIMYDITHRRSFEVAEVIYEKLYDIMGKIRMPVVLVGNKKDLTENREVTEKEGLKLANTWKGVFLEISVKQDESVSNVFDTIIREIEKSNTEQPRNVCFLS